MQPPLPQLTIVIEQPTRRIHQQCPILHAASHEQGEIEQTEQGIRTRGSMHDPALGGAATAATTTQ
jgi:hypothetical protein